MSFGRALSRMDAALSKAFGEHAIHNGRVLCHVVIDRNIERIDNYGEVLDNQIELTVNKSQVLVVAEGDTFKTAASTFTVDSIVSDDGSMIVVSVV